jgi:hypothetical protein
MTQFYSLLPRDELLAMLIEALQVQSVVTPSLEDVDESGNIRVPIHHVDKRRCPLQGEIRIMRYNNNGVWVVKFVKGRGDPLEFRRFFKVPCVKTPSDVRPRPSSAKRQSTLHRVGISRAFSGLVIASRVFRAKFWKDFGALYYY